jgi:hypothetical protein
MNDFSSRRDFLKSAALLPLAAAAGPALSGTTARAAVEPIKRVGGAMLKTSLNAYSFAKLLGTGGTGPLKLVELAEVLSLIHI